MTTISRRSWLALVSGGVWLAPVIATGETLSDDSLPGLEMEFRDPPKAARPWVYWMWLNGNISREGITADLEAMRRVGIGGALIMEDWGRAAGAGAFYESRISGDDSARPIRGGASGLAN